MALVNRKTGTAANRDRQELLKDLQQAGVVDAWKHLDDGRYRITIANRTKTMGTTETEPYLIGVIDALRAHAPGHPGAKVRFRRGWFTGTNTPDPPMRTIVTDGMVQRTHGRGGHLDRVAVLRELDAAGALYFSHSSTRQYIVSTGSQRRVLSVSDEPYMVGVVDALAKVAPDHPGARVKIPSHWIGAA